MVWIGTPSWYFIHWHFHHYHNFYDYPLITNIYIHHYYGHRRATGANARVVSQCVKANENTLPRDFISNEKLQTERIKEYGKFETDYVHHVMSTPKPTGRNDFLQQHSAEYPNLQQAKDEIQIIKPAPVKQPPVIKENPVRPKPMMRPNEERYPVKPRTEPTVKPPVQQHQPQLPRKQKPVTVPRPAKQDKQQPASTGKRK